jgi:spermidine/putrescine-binding protein
MRKEGMIQKIDKTKLTHFNNLDPEMLNKPFDPNNDYSIPYIWGATAIGVNSEAIENRHKLGRSVETGIQRQPAVDRRRARSVPGGAA